MTVCAFDISREMGYFWKLGLGSFTFRVQLSRLYQKVRVENKRLSQLCEVNVQFDFGCIAEMKSAIYFSTKPSGILCNVLRGLNATDISVSFLSDSRKPHCKKNLVVFLTCCDTLLSPSIASSCHTFMSVFAHP